MLGIHQVAVHAHIKYAAAALDKLGAYRKPFVYLGCQTDSRGFIVSLNAVFDRDIHVGGRIQVRLKNCVKE